MVKKIGAFLVGIFLVILVFQLYLSFHRAYSGIALKGYIWVAVLIALAMIVVGFRQRIHMSIIWGVLIILTITFATTFLKEIERYYYNEAIDSSAVLINDLERYYKINHSFPETLSILYQNDNKPHYKVGILSHGYGYAKHDSSFRIYFSLFDGKRFCCYGLSGFWTLCD